MRIIHTADLHLDSKLESHLNKNMAALRKDELIKSFTNLISSAYELKAYVIIISGDLFDTKTPRSSTIKSVEALIKSNPDITFFYVPGNHDEFDFINALEECPKNLIVFNEHWQSYTIGDVVISGIVFNSNTAKYMYDTLSLDKEKKNIVVLHGEVSNYSSNDSINLRLLENKGIDYLALGHIHSYMCGLLDDRGVYAYPGILEPRGFDECGKKGYILINAENEITHSFIKGSIREIHDIELDVSGYSDFSMIIDEAMRLTSHINPNDMVLLRLIGEFESGLFKSIEVLNNMLDSKFFFAYVKDLSRLKLSSSDYENDESLKGEFIRGVLELDELEDVKNDVILCGLKAIMGGDI